MLLMLPERGMNAYARLCVLSQMKNKEHSKIIAKEFSLFIQKTMKEKVPIETSITIMPEN